MATAYHNLSEYDFNSVPNAEEMKFGIVVSEWNYNITGALLQGAVETLKKHGAKEENIKIKEIFGTDRFNHLIIKREDGQVVYSATLNTEEEFSSTRLNEIMEQNPFICSIERCDNT